MCIPVAYWMMLTCVMFSSPVHTCTMYIKCMCTYSTYCALLYVYIYMFNHVCSWIHAFHVCVASLSGERTACMCWPTTPEKVQLSSSPSSCRLLLASPLMSRTKKEILVGFTLYSLLKGTRTPLIYVCLPHCCLIMCREFVCCECCEGNGTGNQTCSHLFCSQRAACFSSLVEQ